MYQELLQAKLEAAVLHYSAQHEQKPSLLQINPEDFRQILPYSDQCRKFGLSIKGVTTISTGDIAKGHYRLIP
ncbi:MAG: hypothetical protein EON98_08765 [Chitinophagaceae bacterium]|nr:MAG: hypothetical protein EON98_08765 [Chitinophagaceae bacterium]